MTPVEGHLPKFESDQHAEWRIADGDVLLLRYDRTTGAWTGRRERPDSATGGPVGPEELSTQEVEIVARAHDLRFRNGSKPL